MEPLDRRTEPDGAGGQRPALDARKAEELMLPPYLPPDAFGAATANQRQTMLTVQNAELARLLALPHDRFWCTVLFAGGPLAAFLQSYRRFAPRPHDAVAVAASGAPVAEDDCAELEVDLLRRVLAVYLRLATREEAPPAAMWSTAGYRQAVERTGLLSLTALLEVAVLAGPANAAAAGRLLKAAFEALPQLRTTELSRLAEQAIGLLDRLLARALSGTFHPA